MGALLHSADLSSAAVSNRLAAQTDKQVRTLSGGERRLLEVGIVLGLDRDYVLLDEPFTGVEPLLIDEIADEIEQAATEGTGVLVTDHYHRYVTPLADDAYVMRQKQCYPLDDEKTMPEQLEEIGYISSRASNEPTGE